MKMIRGAAGLRPRCGLRSPRGRSHHCARLFFTPRQHQAFHRDECVCFKNESNGGVTGFYRENALLSFEDTFVKKNTLLMDIFETWWDERKPHFHVGKLCPLHVAVLLAMLTWRALLSITPSKSDHSNPGKSLYIYVSIF